MPECTYCNCELDDTDRFCPKCGYQGGGSTGEGEMKLTTPQRAGGAGSQRREPPAHTRPQRGTPEKGAKAGTGAVRTFRPLYRPPMLLICVLDDDGGSGEWIRVRKERLVVGRTEGEHCVPHEAGMSGKHLEIVRESREGEYFWTVRDLQTGNGTFARVDRARLRQGQQILLGSRRYCLDAASQGAGASAEGTNAGPRKVTQAWHVIAGAEGIAALVRLQAEGEGERYPLETEEQWIGTDGKACRIAIQEDHFLDPQHAKLYRKGRQWWIEDGGSVNGTWVAIKRIRIDSAAEIQVGEQRFKIRVP